ncbi:MAG: glycoside hydrolase family 15 protein [Anaerolineales bacterium]|jgi:GH15 family glucan-1,4-alpha-glucosidase
MNYQPIENYGVIGDLHTVALVGMDGSVDYMCFPKFDSPSIFLRLLDHEKGGYFSLAPVLEDVHQKQLYIPDTNILLSRFLSDEGVAEVSDFMPVEATEQAHDLIRRAKTVRGEIKYRMVCKPAFDYARATHQVEIRDGEAIFTSNGEDKTVLRLRSSLPLHEEDGAVVSEFTLKTGETASFVLENAEETVGDSSDPNFVAQAFKDTVNFWRGWVGKSDYKGRWREMVHRSALTLKLLTSWHHGPILAAPTFGLPEQIGGERNWDYRFTWIRDASFTIYAFIRLGYTEEAAAFMRWIEERCDDLAPDGTLQTVYGEDGRHDLSEFELSHLEGYQGSQPVRVGNAAYNQLQLDIYGELMDSVYLYDKYGKPISYDLWKNLVRLVDWLCEHWQQPDNGIWEVRGGQREFLYSRLMSWVAVDRAVRLARKRSLPCPFERWQGVRDEIYNDIFDNFWDDKLGAFVQYRGSKALDASSLLMPMVRFISPTDRRWLSHLKAIEEDLVYDSLVYRYRIEDTPVDNLEGTEGTFNMCTFWFVECLSRAGELQKARLYFEKMLGYANHLGLYAEETGPRGEHLGNYPQAFTHLALISAAYDIDRRLSEAGWEA